MRIDHPGKNEESQLPDLWQLAFGDPMDAIRLYFDNGYAPRRCLCTTDGAQVAAAAHWLDCIYPGGRLAYIYAVATHPDYRGRGLCRSLMDEIHRRLAVQGYAGAILVPAEAGLRSMYAKMGYFSATTLREFSCRPGSAVVVEAIAPEEYARLRREYLPAGAVIQEGEGLRYLASWARFYRGDGFLLAAAAEEQTLIGLELLGNADAAPGILTALGYPQGRFRTPGAGTPFAMFRPLQPGAEKPAYLGFAFD